MKKEILDKISKAIQAEISSLTYFYEHLDPRFADAVECILNSKGKVILTGVGKSGDIAKKISSTLSSTGTPAIFIHPTDSAHGDAGIIAKDDVVIAIGKSGESEELIALIPTIKRIGAKLISLTANEKSRLALESDILILTPVLQEACPLDLAPTSSTTIALVAGDAIAMSLMELKNFQADDFALYHPAGRLGKRLSLKIDDVMRKGVEKPFVYLESNLESILNQITTKRVGAVAVISQEETFLGLITDYDIRKALTENKLTVQTSANEIMNRKAIFFLSGNKAYSILLEMENRESPISVAPILDENHKYLGMISIHDLLKIGL
jgi:arabinose-5-phosphate isomerase